MSLSLLHKSSSTCVGQIVAQVVSFTDCITVVCFFLFSIKVCMCCQDNGVGNGKGAGRRDIL